MRARFTVLAIAAATCTSALASAEVPRDLVAHEEPRRPRIAVMVNPALAPVGRIGARVELALLDSQAVFVEPAWFAKYVGAIDREVRGGQLDVGWHLYPAARGLRGPFLGVRATMAYGDTQEATATLAGAGFDLGWSWVLSGGAAIQLGGGMAWARLVARAKPGAVAELDVLEPAQRSQIESASIAASFLLPVATTGVGLAF
jgi:hypothetical protein